MPKSVCPNTSFLIFKQDDKHESGVSDCDGVATFTDPVCEVKVHDVIGTVVVSLFDGEVAPVVEASLHTRAIARRVAGPTRPRAEIPCCD